MHKDAAASTRIKGVATITVLNKTIIEKSQEWYCTPAISEIQGQSVHHSEFQASLGETLYLKCQAKTTQSLKIKPPTKNKGNVLRVKRKAKSIRDQPGNNAEQKLTSHTNTKSCSVPAAEVPKISQQLLFHICFRDKALLW